MRRSCLKEFPQVPGIDNADLLQVCGGLAACIPVLAEAIQPYPRYICLSTSVQPHAASASSVPLAQHLQHSTEQLKAPACVQARRGRPHWVTAAMSTSSRSVTTLQLAPSSL